MLDFSLSDKAGLLIRQTHHWAADVFMAAIVVHLMRVFFTGAFRKPRELTWLVGLLLLFTALLEGFLGYSLVDDLLSGMGLAIGYGVGLSIPVDRWPADACDLRGAVPGQARLLLADVHRTRVPAPGSARDVDRDPSGADHGPPPHAVSGEQADDRATDRRCAVVPRPGATLAGADVLHRRPVVPARRAGPDQPDLAVGAVHTYLGTNGAQPDWYLGWLIGALRLMPSFDVTIGHFTLVPNPFWGGALFPLFVLAVLASFPWVERRLSGDRGVHNLADRPRDAPLRTAFGVAFLSWVFLVFVFGAADRHVRAVRASYNTQLYVFRIGIWVVPASCSSSPAAGAERSRWLKASNARARRPRTKFTRGSASPRSSRRPLSEPAGGSTRWAPAATPTTTPSPKRSSRPSRKGS